MAQYRQHTSTHSNGIEYYMSHGGYSIALGYLIAGKIDILASNYSRVRFIPRIIGV